MADEKHEPTLVSVIIQYYRGGQPTIVRGLIGMPKESLEQLAARTQLARDQYHKQMIGGVVGGDYVYDIMLGELTHTLEPPPPPPPVPVVKITTLNPALTGRRASASARPARTLKVPR